MCIKKRNRKRTCEACLPLRLLPPSLISIPHPVNIFGVNLNACGAKANARFVFGGSTTERLTGDILRSSPAQERTARRRINPAYLRVLSFGTSSVPSFYSAYDAS